MLSYKEHNYDKTNNPSDQDTHEKHEEVNRTDEINNINHFHESLKDISTLNEQLKAKRENLNVRKTVANFDFEIASSRVTITSFKELLISRSRSLGRLKEHSKRSTRCS